MTTRQIEKVISAENGHLCARVARRADGSLITIDGTDRTGPATRAAGLIIGLTLAAGTAQAQDKPIFKHPILYLKNLTRTSS